MSTPWKVLVAGLILGLNRPGFTRHLRAVHYGRDGGGYEWQAVLG
jgi:hypothetical protein